jgi:radical SAM superfamily enzyme YgiQ (UPF0313 family)
MKKLGYECDIFFEAISPISKEDLRQYGIVGIGSITSTIGAAYRLADSLKGKGPVVVMGGTHATFMPREALEYCDYVVLGEGEGVFPALASALENGESLDTVKGLAFLRSDGTMQVTGQCEPVDFAGLPSPDFSLCPQIAPGSVPPIISTSRGCPHGCTFCSVTAVFGKRYRFKSNEQVISELMPILHRSVCFGDDNFCANPKRTKSLLKDMIDKDAVPLRWSGEMAIQAAMDEEMLGLMRRTRCRTVYVGIESIDSAALKRMGKAHQADIIPRCIGNLHDNGIGVHGMFVVSPDDEPDSIGKIVDFAVQTDLDTIQLCAMTPFPGTRCYEEYGGRLLHQDWRYYDGMHVVVQPKACSAFEMQTEIIGQMKRFYSLGRVLGAYRLGRAWRIKYRAGGYALMRRWARENAGYVERLKTGYYPRQKPEALPLLRSAGYSMSSTAILTSAADLKT